MLDSWLERASSSRPTASSFLNRERMFDSCRGILLRSLQRFGWSSATMFPFAS